MPIIVQYQAGYATIPLDVQDAVLLMVKTRWFARQRDPMMKMENTEGVYSGNTAARNWALAARAISAPDVASMLERYRTLKMA